MPNDYIAIRDLPVDWMAFGVGALLLLFPLPLFYGKDVQYRELDRTWRRLLSSVFALSWHWIELLRALGGTWLLMQSISLGRSISDQMPPLIAVLFLAVVVCVGVVVQMVSCKASDSFNAGFATVVAVVAVLFPPIVAGLSLILAIMVAVGVRSAVAFFGALAASVAVLGAALYQNWLVLGAGVVASFLPLILPMMFHRELVLAHRRVKDE